MLPENRASVGLNVLHLFYAVDHSGPPLNTDALGAVLSSNPDEELQITTAAMLGHKGDLGVMALCPTQRPLRRLQSELSASGLLLRDSYCSLTELSEYGKGMPEERKQARLYPQLPPAGKPAFCFYPMSKRREQSANWFQEDFDTRNRMMHEHGMSGRKFAGRVVQVVTGSSGLDDYEWGVTLFAQHVDDLKDVVYTMRFDEASARFADFGTFYIGTVGDPGDVLDALRSS